MPWKDLRVERQRLLLTQDYEEGSSVSELAEIYGLSRKTIYKWLERHDHHGVAGLADLSRRPLSSPHEVSFEVEQAIIEARHRWKWGPRKLRVKLCEQDEARQWPSISTIASILKNKGLVVERRRRTRTPIQTPPYASPETSNAVWCADYKGYFRVRDGTRIDPLTITDASSRYLLRCQIVERTDFAHASAVFEGAFREFGMPGVIHTDNGVPFASVAPGGLSRLSMWFVRLGITPERSRPGSPQDNGRHERMHRTLKQATARRRKPQRGCSRKLLTPSVTNLTSTGRIRLSGISRRQPAIRAAAAPGRGACLSWSMPTTFRCGASRNREASDGEGSAPSSARCFATNHSD
jgi:putative transposase